MFSYRIVAVSAVLAFACGGQKQSADETARDLSLAPAESVAALSDQPQPGMERIAEGIYFSQGVGPVLEDPSSDFSADSTRVFAGYAGWAPGQLEAEIERGDWIVAWESPAVGFTRDVKKLWRKLFRSWSGRWT